MSRSTLSTLLVAIALGAAGCVGGRDTTGAGTEEVNAGANTSAERTMEGSFEAGGVTGFRINQRQGPEAREVVAVDLSTLNLPGEALVGRTLRIAGKVERRRTGTLPNGTGIFQEVLVATEVVERSDKSVTLTGTLERRDGELLIVSRTPENAEPVDQHVDQTAVELTPPLTDRLIGQKVSAKGKLASRFLARPGVAGGSFLTSRDLVILETLSAL